MHRNLKWQMEQAETQNLVTSYFRLFCDFYVTGELWRMLAHQPPLAWAESGRTGPEDEEPGWADTWRADHWGGRHVGTCTVRAWSLRPAAQSLMTNFQSVEEWSPSRGVVISRWSVQCDPVTCQPNHNLNQPPTDHFSEKAKITYSSFSFTWSMIYRIKLGFKLYLYGVN